MRPGPTLLILLLSAPSLGGCVASMAASAVGAAVQAADAPNRRPITQDRRAAATEACRARAATSGNVQIIDVEQNNTGMVTVWGTVTDAQRRQSFECRFEGRVLSFRLREIRTGG